jgi:hypothetical protein
LNMVFWSHMSSKYATFEKEKPWQDGQYSLVVHARLYGEIYERERLWPVEDVLFWSHMFIRYR